MASDSIQMAAEGWRIISRYEDSRQSARYLLRWLAVSLNLRAAALVYSSRQSGYEWREQVDHMSPDVSEGQRWERSFPGSPSRWILEGDRSALDSRRELLDLLADQWSTLHDDFLRPATSGKNFDSSAAESRFPAWTALASSSRIVLSCLPRISLSGRPLLLIGETGAGKAHLASLIHRSGPNPAAPLSLSDTPGEDGTLYVTDWSDLSIEEKKHRLNDSRRLIAGRIPGGKTESRRGTWNEITGGSGITLNVPPLRERQEDIPALSGFLLKEICSSAGLRVPEISPEAVDALGAYSWPGNVRELKECMAGICDNPAIPERIGVGLLPPEVRGASGCRSLMSFSERLSTLEIEALKEELARHRGNITRTALAMGLTPRQVSWRIRKYGINPGEFKSHLRGGNRC